MSPRRNYPNSKLTLEPEQSAVIRDIFREKGYETGESIAAALFKTTACSAYKNQYSLGTAVRSILRGERAIPYRMRKGIIELHENDERLKFLEESPTETMPVQYKSTVWDRILVNYFSQLKQTGRKLKEVSPRLDIQGKIELVRSLDDIVNRVKSLDEIIQKYST